MQHSGLRLRLTRATVLNRDAISHDDTGGRVFFSSTGRTLEADGEIRLLSVGVDIRSATAHLVFSRIVLQKRDSR